MRATISSHVDRFHLIIQYKYVMRAQYKLLLWFSGMNHGVVC